MVEIGRAEADTLVHAAADGENQAVEGDVVGYVGVADGTEQDGVVGVEALQAVVGHHGAGLAVEVGAPREVGEMETEVAAGGGEGFEDFLAFGDDFGADTVAGDDCYGVGGQGGASLWKLGAGDRIASGRLTFQRGGR